MEINVLEESKTRIVFEIIGEDHTLCNAIKKILLDDPKVKVATYAVKHPSVGVPHMIIETSGKTPRDALLDAAKILKKDYSSFLKSVEKEIK